MKKKKYPPLYKRLNEEVHEDVSKKHYCASTRTYMRSSWEVDVANILDLLGIEFQYEPRRFYFRKERESYLPDFYLPEYKVWIEVKGFYDQRSQKRMRLFKKYYNTETLFMIFKEEYEQIVRDPFYLKILIDSANKERERRERRQM
ncbi:hypothetical protein EG878_14750 [Enterococcus faecalis]|nr:hypothetical protein EG878_14750 [Enterococcus faecalis]